MLAGAHQRKQNSHNFWRVGTLTILATLIFSLGFAVAGRENAHATTPAEPNTWTLLAAGERTAVFSTASDYLVSTGSNLSNGTYWYFGGYAKGFAPSDTLDIKVNQYSGYRDAKDLATCTSANKGDQRLSVEVNPGASGGARLWATIRVGCLDTYNTSSTVVAFYQANDLPSYYPSGPQSNVSNTLTGNGWTICSIYDFKSSQPLVSNITNACSQRYILMAANASYQSAPTVSTFSSSTATPRNDSNASYSVVFSQSVTGLATDDFENAGTATGCSYTVTGSGTTYTLSISSCSDGTIQPRIKTNSVAGSTFDGPASAATTTSTITKDSVAPTASVTVATILASGNASVQSSEAGAAYLVNETVTVTNLASITGAADNLQNSVSITTANTNTNLAATGLVPGTYKLYTIDGAGNLSAASTNTISIKPATPGTPDLDAASDLGTSNADNNTSDDTPTFNVSSLISGASVTVAATPSSGNAVTCSFTSTGNSGSCTFISLSNGTYSVAAVQSFGGLNSDTSTALANVVINKATISRPARPDLATSSDSGSSSSDDLTNDNTPTINVTGTFTGTATVTAAKMGSTSVTCSVSSSTCTLSTLSDGVWIITVTDGDATGNSATSETLSITVDTIAPSTPTISAQTVSDRESISIQVAETGTAYLYRWLLTNTPSTPADVTTKASEFWNSVAVVANTSTSISTLDLGTGYNYKLYVVDEAGNISSGSTNLVKVDPASSPTISGPTRPSSSSPADKVGSTLTNVMAVSGLPVPTISYQYVRCPSVSGNWVPTCVDIPGATTSTYILTAEDAGQHIGVEITATNSQGTTVQIGVATAKVEASVPGTPTSVATTITGSTTASIAFTAPASNGASITDYDLEYSSNNGSTWTSFNNGTSTANPILVTGLTAKTSYIFRVKAKNSAGDGSFSIATSPQTTLQAPSVSTNDAPQNLASPGVFKVGDTITNQMTFDGFPNPTLSYQFLRCPTVTYSSNDCVEIPSATASTYTLTGDDVGKYMGVKITATNTSGSLVRTPMRNTLVAAASPGAPTSVAASITGSTTATVSFTAPASNGGSAITGYTVTSTPSGAVCAVGANSTTYNCTGLAAGTSYTFKVKATNTVGSGSDSVASSSQTTEANPTIAVALEGSLTVVPITVPVRITATASKPGTITFTQDGTNLNQCVNIQTSESGSNHTSTCTWTPALNISGHGGVRSIVATLTPTSSNYQSVNASKSISVTNIGGVNFPAPSITNVVVSGNSATVYFNVGSPTLGAIGYSNSASWINFQYSLDGGTSWNETGTYYYLTSNGDWVNFNAAPSPLVISGLSGQTYNFQIRQQIYHAPGSYPNTYWLVAPSVASPNTGGGSQAYSFTVVAPLSTTTSIATKSLTADTAATSFTPITASGGGSSKTYSISPSLPSGLSLNTSTGAISGTPIGASASTSYTVSVTDGSSTSTATFSLGVNAALSSSAGTVPSGVYKDVAVTAFTPVSFSGGTSPVTYSVSPSLPAGLSLNTSTGVISGTATGTAASTTYTVTATDANGDSEASAFAFAVTNQPTAPGAPTIGAATSTGQTTATVAFTAPANTGGAAITTYTVTASPGGITATGSSSPITVTGLIAGTAYTFSITATNAAGLTSSSSSPSSSITTESAPVQNNNNGGGGGGGGGAPAPAPEPAPEPVCNAACVAAQNAAAKAAADKVAADKAAAEKLVADKAAAVAVAEKTKVDVSAAVAAATAAAEKVSAATVAKAAADTIAAAVSTVVNSANAAQTSTSKITSEAAASIKSAPAAATKAASTSSANSKANTAATQVKAAAIAAQKAAASSQAQTSAAPEIAFGSSNTASAASQAAAKADAAARAGKAAANEVAAAAEAKSIESRATATALQNEANAAVAEVIAEQKVASALATEAKAAADKASAATAEKIVATAAAKTAAETLVTLLTEKVAIAEKVATAVSEEVRAEAQKTLDTVNIKIAEAERAVTETVSKADAAIAAQAEAIKVAEATKATAEAQVTKVDQLLAAVPTKATAAVRAASVAAVAAKVATVAKAAAAKIPSRAVISAKPGVSTGKNSTRATISGLKPGQKVKVTVNVKPKP